MGGLYRDRLRLLFLLPQSIIFNLHSRQTNILQPEQTSTLHFCSLRIAVSCLSQSSTQQIDWINESSFLKSIV